MITWNLGSLQTRRADVLNLLQFHTPHMLFVQECRLKMELPTRGRRQPDRWAMFFIRTHLVTLHVSREEA